MRGQPIRPRTHPVGRSAPPPAPRPPPPAGRRRGGIRRTLRGRARRRRQAREVGDLHLPPGVGRRGIGDLGRAAGQHDSRQQGSRPGGRVRRGPVALSSRLTPHRAQGPAAPTRRTAASSKLAHSRLVSRSTSTAPLGDVVGPAPGELMARRQPRQLHVDGDAACRRTRSGGSATSGRLSQQQRAAAGRRRSPACTRQGRCSSPQPVQSARRAQLRGPPRAKGAPDQLLGAPAAHTRMAVACTRMGMLVRHR